MFAKDLKFCFLVFSTISRKEYCAYLPEIKVTTCGKICHIICTKSNLDKLPYNRMRDSL